MFNKLPRLPKAILEELEGHDWHLEQGSKHWKIIIDGKMAAIWPRGSSGEDNTPGRGLLNTRSQIRRALRNHA